MQRNINNENEFNSKIKSGIITFLITLILLLNLYFFQIYSNPEPFQAEEIVLDFSGGGSNSQNQITENNNLKDSEESKTEEEIKIPKEKPKEAPKKEPNLITEETKKDVPIVKKSIEKNTKDSKKEETKNTSINKNTNKSNSDNESPKNNSDGKAKSITDLFLKGKNSSNKSSSENTNNGNNSDGNSSSSGKGEFIGNASGGRKLIAFIPGTLNRSNEPNPSHSCGDDRGTVIIAYTVSKLGTVISARLQSGNASSCIINTAISWVKKYVKAEPGNQIVSSTYKVEF